MHHFFFVKPKQPLLIKMNHSFLLFLIPTIIFKMPLQKSISVLILTYTTFLYHNNEMSENNKNGYDDDDEIDMMDPDKADGEEDYATKYTLVGPGGRKLSDGQKKAWDDRKIYTKYGYNCELFKWVVLYDESKFEKVDKFKDESMDLVYIDAKHDYESEKREIELYLPKIKNKGILAGHDYHHVWPGVKKAVNFAVGTPDKVFRDTTWVKIIDRNV